MIYPLRKKISKQAQLLTSPSGNKWRNIQNRGKKTGFSLATLWKGNFLKAPRQMAFLTGNKWRKNNFIKAAIFGHSRCLPIEGTKLFLKTPTKTFSPSRNKWRNIQNRGEKTDFPLPTYWEDFEIHSKKVSHREYVKKLWIFRKTLPKTASPSGNKWEVNFREGPKKHPL